MPRHLDLSSRSRTGQYARAAYRLSQLCGIDPMRPVSVARYILPYVNDLRRFRALTKGASSQLPFGALHPILTQRENSSGKASGHYFHQDLLVARRVFARNPDKHVDIGSRIDGFVAHVASFRQIEVFDVRPLRSTIPNVQFRQCDLMALEPEYVGYSSSISCLHTLEHFGLGRYGDTLDPDGHLKGIDGLWRMCRPGGRVYLSVPIGEQRIEFNAHRVFAVKPFLDLLRPKFELIALSFVDDAGTLHEDISPSEPELQNNLGCHYGCGIFELDRRP